MKINPNYKRLAELSARLAEYYPKLPCNNNPKLFIQTKNLRTFRYDDGVESIEWNNIGRHDAYKLSPYDETLLLDTDYFIQNDSLTNYFGSVHELLCHNYSWDISGNDVFRHDKYLTAPGNNFEMRWATVMYFKNVNTVNNYLIHGVLSTTIMNIIVNYLIPRKSHLEMTLHLV